MQIVLSDSRLVPDRAAATVNKGRVIDEQKARIERRSLRVMYGGSSHLLTGHFKFQAGLSGGQLKGLSKLVSKAAGSFMS